MSMSNSNSTIIESLKKRISSSNTMTEKAKQDLYGILDGTRIAPLTSDTMAKKIFSPELHPDRFNFIIRHVMNDKRLSVAGSAKDELPIESSGAKRTVTDISAILKDNRYADIEVQALAQEFIFNRSDIYSSRILLFQYSVPNGQSKNSIDYGNTPGVIMIVLMRDRPKEFKEFKSNHYIHRITKAVADSGMTFKMLRQTAFVQLDKALELLLSKSYNEDEDVELLKLCAMMADVNNEAIADILESDNFLTDIRNDAMRFSLDKEVQPMLIEEEMTIWDETVGKALERNMYLNEGRAEGRTNALTDVSSLLSWLFANNRIEDAKKAGEDPAYLAKMLEEYKQAN